MPLSRNYLYVFLLINSIVAFLSSLAISSPDSSSNCQDLKSCKTCDFPLELPYQLTVAYHRDEINKATRSDRFLRYSTGSSSSSGRGRKQLPGRIYPITVYYITLLLLLIELRGFLRKIIGF